MQKIIIIRYSEIHLKGNNRGFFEHALSMNLKTALKEFKCEVKKIGCRYVISGYDKDKEKNIAEAARCVFGVHSLSMGSEIATYPSDESRDPETLTSRIFEAVLDIAPRSGTFRVECNRADKKFPVRSPDFAGEIGARIIEKFPDLKVDLHSPENTVYIDIRDTGNTFIYSSVLPAVNGMPVGTGGKGLALLSGGIDSPVAIYMMAKRGMLIRALHFHSFPYTSSRAKEKVIKLAETVSKYAMHLKLYSISVTEIQEAIHKNCPEEMMITILRRFMMRIATIVAEKFDCKAIITGESLGQVASQTIESLTSSNACTHLPVLRPLIGFDKEEIVTIARHIDTFNISIEPYEDCCTVFLPKNPVTRPTLRSVEKAEASLDADTLVKNALSTLETIKIRL